MAYYFLSCVIVAMITGMVSIVGVVFASVIAKNIDYRYNVKKYLYDKREMPYDKSENNYLYRLCIAKYFTNAVIWSILVISKKER